MATSLVQRNKVVSKRKGMLAGAAAGGTAALVVVGAPAILAVGGVVGAVYLGWDWLQFRIKNGMRF